MKTWRLKKGGERRIRQGHPWVFAGELSHSTKEIQPGEIIELKDSKDHFVAFGYGSATSQIAFRKLSSSTKEKDLLSVDFFVRRLQLARDHRKAAGWDQFSHRWVFAEADGLPGLIVDAFLTAQGWVIVVQASTAGMNQALPNLYAALETFTRDLGEISIVEAPNSKSRILEGLAVGEKRRVTGMASLDDAIEIHLKDGLKLQADLLKGQKTGFFLDQQWNADLLTRLLKRQQPDGPLRVLDLCCYVGQWSAHLSLMGRSMGFPVQVTLLDASAAALSLAAQNMGALGAQVETLEGDAMDLTANLNPSSFDVVICDPPAFVKKKADLETGLRAYVKLNRDALKALKTGGIYVASSCSGLVKSADWTQVLRESSLKSGRSLRHLIQGGHGPDHPLKPEFPEGEYLKCVISRAETPL